MLINARIKTFTFLVRFGENGFGRFKAVKGISTRTKNIQVRAETRLESGTLRM